MTPTHLPILQSLDDLALASPRRARVFGRVGPADALPLYAFSFGDLSQPALLVAAGVHGDEPEGVLALRNWLAARIADDTPPLPFPVLVLPCVNPAGLAAGTRTNALDQDINRQFHADVTPETAAVRRLLAPRRLFAVVDMHTDPRADGFYLFELLRPNTEGVASAWQSQMKAQGMVLEPQPTYGGLVGKDGLLVPTPAQIERFGHDAPGQSLAEWGWHRGVRRCYVLETPRAAADLHAGALQQLLTLLAPLYADNMPATAASLTELGK